MTSMTSDAVDSTPEHCNQLDYIAPEKDFKTDIQVIEVISCSDDQTR
jgi:hypothetical protein